MIKIEKIKPHKLNRLKFLKPLLNENFVLAGGALRHLFDFNEGISDFDLFPVGHKTVEEKLAAIESKIILLESGFSARRVFTGKKKKIYSFILKTGEKIQIIDQYPDLLMQDTVELLDLFDFNACRIAWNGKELFLSKNAPRDIRKKEISLNRLTYPAATIKRLLKYQSKRYKINNCIQSIVTRIAATPSLALNESIYIDEREI